jgi:hypothetical protein
MLPYDMWEYAGSPSSRHWELKATRDMPQVARNPQFQAAVAPAEHAAWAYDVMREDPTLGPIKNAVGVPAYTLGKLAGVLKGRTPASWDELMAGYYGSNQGFAANWPGIAPPGQYPQSAEEVIGPALEAERRLAQIRMDRRYRPEEAVMIPGEPKLRKRYP